MKPTRDELIEHVESLTAAIVTKNLEINSLQAKLREAERRAVERCAELAEQWADEARRDKSWAECAAASGIAQNIRSTLPSAREGGS